MIYLRIATTMPGAYYRFCQLPHQICIWSLGLMLIISCGVDTSELREPPPPRDRIDGDRPKVEGSASTRTSSDSDIRAQSEEQMMDADDDDGSTPPIDPSDAPESNAQSPSNSTKSPEEFGLPPASISASPTSDPCVQASTSLNGLYLVKIDASTRSAEIQLSNAAEILSLSAGADMQKLVLNYSTGESIQIGCAESFTINLLGGNDQISIPGLPFNLTVNCGAGDDKVQLVAGGNAMGRSLVISGGIGSDSFTISSSGGWGSIRTNGD